MRKNVVSVLSAALLATALFSGSAFAATTAHIDTTVNFRSAPATGSQVYGTIKSGTDVTVVELTNSYWVRVSYNGREGYVSRSYVSLSGSSQSSTAKASDIIAYGKTFMGVKYTWGGNTPAQGFDCSGFIRYIFAHYGVNVTRQSTASSQQDGYVVSRSNLKPGDLIYFSTSASNGKVAHIGVYIGNGKVLHTFGSPGVTISDMTSGWWSKHYVMARRVL